MRTQIKYIFQGWKNFIYYKFFHKNKTELQINRLNICKKCNNFKRTTRQCKVCGCFLDAKVMCDFPLDKNKKAIFDIDENGKFIYACYLKKW